MKVEEKTLGIIRELTEKGFEAYVAGGAARDTLFGEEPEDFDVVTNAGPGEIAALFKKRRVRIVGVSFKVCLVDGIEVATYRKRGGHVTAPGKRHADYAGSLKEDLAGRDLTINALAYSPLTGETVDLFGGARDLKEGIIRFTLDANERIMEDPLRIIRACRFKAKYRGRFAEETFVNLKEHARLIGPHVAPERIRMEMLKALSCEKPGLFFEALGEIGALGVILPALDDCRGVDGGPHHGETVFEHSLLALDAVPRKYPLLRLAALLHDVGKPSSLTMKNGAPTFVGHEKKGAELAGDLLRGLKFSNDELSFVTSLVLLHMRTMEKETTPRAVRRLIKALNDAGVDHRDWIRLRIADRKANLKRPGYALSEIRAMVKMLRNELNPEGGKRGFCVKDLAVDGREIMELLKIPQGPGVGKVMESLLDRVLDDPGLNSRETLLGIAEKLGGSDEKATRDAAG